LPERVAEPLEEVGAVGVAEEEKACVAPVRGDVVDAGLEITERPCHSVSVDPAAAHLFVHAELTHTCNSSALTARADRRRCPTPKITSELI
jgi:hypothetical protein